MAHLVANLLHWHALAREGVVDIAERLVARRDCGVEREVVEGDGWHTTT